MARANDQTNNTSTEAEWEALAPMLDQGLSRLGEADRNALLLRFFEKKSLRQVGESLGISEEAAQKRVTRAIGKLRDFFNHRGATVSAGALAVLLTTESIKAAPVGLSGTVTMATTTAAAGGSTAAAAAAKGAMLAMAMHKTVAMTAAGLVLLLGIGAGTMAVKSVMGTSSRTRQVTVPTTPPAPNRSTVVFSDGSSASVLGIAETSSPTMGSGNWLSTLIGARGGSGRVGGVSPSNQPKEWWTTDGKSQTAPDMPMPFGQISAGDGPGRRQVLFVFAIRGPAATDGGINVRVPNTRGSANTSRIDGQQQFQHYVCSLPDNVDRTDIRLGMSRGDWREDASIAPATTTQPTTRTTGGKFFTKLSQVGLDVVVAIDENRRPPAADRAVQMVAVLKDGRTVTAHEWRGGPGGFGQVKFKCRLDQLDHIAFKTRPYEWQTIGNVALKPAAAAATTSATTRVASTTK
jgi:hypothetical protein